MKKTPEKIIREQTAITFSQEGDDCDESENTQSIKIQSANAGAGDYYIISTERWAFDSIDEFVALLKKIPLQKEPK
jgi:hypothetical protein